jgi:ABC-type polysaccharide/polyol phosphate transport system ATPase subunit
MSRISVTDVWFSYPVLRGSERSIKDRMVRLLGLAHGIPVPQRSVQALRGLSLEVREGERVGLLGNNGAGKSTLLRLLAGIFVPNRGQLDVQGKVSTMLNVQMGLEPSATGLENIYLIGLLNGMRTSEIEARLESIREFAQLDDYLSMPVSTYSTGMTVRLSFATITELRPDILLMDEWIGAGDMRFKEAARQRLEGMIDTSRIMVLATHRLDLVTEICTSVAVLEKGQVVFRGGVEEGIAWYRGQMPQRRVV